MTTLVVSFARKVLGTPGAVCASVSTSISDTQRYVTRSVSSTVDRTKAVVSSSVQKTNSVARFTFRIAFRPFVWPLELSLDLSRRITLQVLISIREILVALDEYAVAFERHLSNKTVNEEGENGITANKPTEINHQSCEACQTKKTEAEKPQSHATRKLKQNAAETRRLKEANRTLRKRAKCVECKYETLRAEISALREVYSEKLADLEEERDVVENDRRSFIRFINSAQKLAQDCHGDVETLMRDLYDLASTTDPSQDINLDMSFEELRTNGTDGEFYDLSDSDVGYCDDEIVSNSRSLQLGYGNHLGHQDNNTTSGCSSMASLYKGSQNDINKGSSYDESHA